MGKDAIEYVETGTGPAVLLVPGSFGTGAGWKGVIGHLGPHYRVVTTSLLGYGATAERRPSGHADMLLHVEVLDEICDRIDAPVHMVGHSFGGLAVLAHAIHGRHKALSLSLIEANPFGTFKTTGDRGHYAMFEALIERYFASFHAGEPEAARHIIDFYGGAGAFDAFPQKVRAYVMATTAVNVADWLCAKPFEPPLDAYRRIGVPVAVVRGGSGHPAMRRIAEILSATMPCAAMTSISDGSHFLPSTHPAEIAPILRATIAAGEACARNR